MHLQTPGYLDARVPIFDVYACKLALDLFALVRNLQICQGGLRFVWSRVLRVSTDPAREEINNLSATRCYSQPTSMLPLLNSQIDADQDGSGMKFISPSDTLPEATPARVI